MNISGLQKMTLLDYPGHVACTVFLGGCDFRCPFCHNFELVTGKTEPVMGEEELLAFLSKRKGLLEGVAVTGGEPCLYQRDLPRLLGRIRELGFMTKLDTNGYHPALLGDLLKDQLVDYVAMDIKNSPRKYAQTAGLTPEHFDLDRITKSIALLMEGSVDYEFRTTVVKELHEETDFEQIGEMIPGAKRYFLQSFTDRDTVPFEGLHAPEPEEMQRFAEAARVRIPDTLIRGM